MLHKILVFKIFWLLIHNSNSIGFVCADEKFLCSRRNDCSDWIVTTNTDPSTDDPRLRPTIANGYIGTIIGHSVLHVNGFYYGRTIASDRVKVPNRMNINITFEGVKKYSMNFQTGIFREVVWNEKLGVNLSVSRYASMDTKHYLVTEIKMEREKFSFEDVSPKVEVNADENTSDMNVTSDTNNPTLGYHIFQAIPSILETDNVTAPNLTVISTNIPENGLLTLKSSQKSHTWVFYSVFTINNRSFAMELYEKGKDLAKICENGTSGFMQAHINIWTNIWESRFDVHGNSELATKIHAAFYYILSSLPMSPKYDDDEWPFYGISPESLAGYDEGSYWGHVFWDQDLWMLIGLSTQYPEVVKKTLTDTRIRILNVAKENAKISENSGARYPWELAYSGYETARWEPAAVNEVHVTGDSALSAQMYLRITGDSDFAQKYYPTSIEIAEYYYSLVKPVPQKQDLVGIYNIMGPDEYHYPVNNSVYMNSIAKIALELPNFIYNNFNITEERPLEKWANASKRLYILYDNERKYHPQYEGYKYGELIKQADVILLGYPLLVEMDPEVRRNDLLLYQASTDAIEGPAMTWAMHSIGWLELGEEAFAESQFNRNFAYMKKPFYTWTETATGIGAVNFVTGIGGFIQNLLHGYLGLKIFENRLEFTPYPIPDTTGYSVHGVNYQGMVFSFEIINATVEIRLTSQPNPEYVLIDEKENKIAINSMGTIFSGPLKVKRRIEYPRGTGTC